MKPAVAKMKRAVAKMERTRRSVPKASIRWLVGRIHVGTPAEEVASDFTERARKAGASEAETAAIVEYALQSHYANQAEYRAVMSGRF